MHRFWVRVFSALILGLTLFSGVGSVRAVNDTTPPVVQSASLSASTVVAGNAITLTVHITDDVTGVSGAYFGFHGDNAHDLNAYLTRISGTAQDGMYQSVITPPSTYPSGTYTVSYISATDLAANNVYYSTCCVPQIPAADNVSFTVTDTATPTTTRTTIAADHNPATVGQSVTFTATVSVPPPVLARPLRAPPLPSRTTVRLLARVPFPQAARQPSPLPRFLPVHTRSRRPSRAMRPSPPVPPPRSMSRLIPPPPGQATLR